jgi:hypothetical protein
VLCQENITHEQQQTDSSSSHEAFQIGEELCNPRVGAMFTVHQLGGHHLQLASAAKRQQQQQ